MRNAIVVLTKVPKAGETKTRLTTERGGILTPEEAKELYEACLLDVIESCIAANCCDIYICHNQDGDHKYLVQLLASLSQPQAIRKIFTDQGGTFDKVMQYAADYVLQEGQHGRLAESVLIVGGDMPCLQPGTIQEAIRKLERLAASQPAFYCAQTCLETKPEVGAAIVESMDQECGFNIIGYTCTTPFNFEEVFYNQNGITALDMIARKASAQHIPLGVVEMLPDIDLPVDLASVIPVIQTLEIAEKFDPDVVAPKRTIKILQELGLECIAPVS